MVVRPFLRSLLSCTISGLLSIRFTVPLGLDHIPSTFYFCDGRIIKKNFRKCSCTPRTTIIRWRSWALFNICFNWSLLHFRVSYVKATAFILVYKRAKISHSCKGELVVGLAGWRISNGGGQPDWRHLGGLWDLYSISLVAWCFLWHCICAVVLVDCTIPWIYHLLSRRSIGLGGAFLHG